MWQQLNGCRCGQAVQLFFRPNVTMRKKCDLSDFDHGMIVGARQGFFYQKLLISMHSRSLQRMVWKAKIQWAAVLREKCIVNKWGQRRRASLVEADRKTITTHYNSGMHNSISEHTMCLQQQKTNKCNKYLIKCSQSVFSESIFPRELALSDPQLQVAPVNENHTRWCTLVPGDVQKGQGSGDNSPGTRGVWKTGHIWGTRVLAWY